MAGTSTGSLLSSCLALKANATTLEKEHSNDDYKGQTHPQYWCDEITTNIEAAAPDIFTSNGIADYGVFISFFLFITVFGGLFFLAGNHRYNRKAKLRAFEDVAAFLTESEEKLKKKEEIEKNILSKMVSNI